MLASIVHFVKQTPNNNQVSDVNIVIKLAIQGKITTIAMQILKIRIDRYFNFQLIRYVFDI
jgi:hypothetical protein